MKIKICEDKKPAEHGDRVYAYNILMTIAEHETDQHFELHLTARVNGSTVTELIAGSSKLSKQQIKQTLYNGAVWIEDRSGIRRIRRAKKVLKVGDSIHLYYDRNIQQQHCPAAELVADLGDYSVWNKPCGMYSQGSRWGDHCTIYRFAETHLQPQRPAFIVHRLDRATNGLMLLAHSKSMANTLARMFEQRSIEKHYRATVTGNIDRDELPIHIDRDIDGKRAVSDIIRIESHTTDSTRLVVRIETGRKHQIRRHLADIGHPVVGDRLYGTADVTAGIDLQLQCCLLRFTCPVEQVTRIYELDHSPNSEPKDSFGPRE